MRNSRALGATSRVILELKPFGISIRGPIGSEPWVGRNTGKMSGNFKAQPISALDAILFFFLLVREKNGVANEVLKSSITGKEGV